MYDTVETGNLPPNDPGTTSLVLTSKRNDHSEMPAIKSMTIAEKRIPVVGISQIHSRRSLPALRLTAVEEADMCTLSAAPLSCCSHIRYSRFAKEQHSCSNEPFQQLRQCPLTSFPNVTKTSNLPSRQPASPTHSLARFAFRRVSCYWHGYLHQAMEHARLPCAVAKPRAHARAHVVPGLQHLRWARCRIGLVLRLLIPSLRPRRDLLLPEKTEIVRYDLGGLNG